MRSILQCCLKKPVVAENPEEGNEEKNDKAVIPMAEAMDVANALEINAEQTTDPETYYSQFTFPFRAGISEDDLEFAARPETPDDRILDLLLIMDCTSSMSSWIELCKRTLKDCIDDLTASHEELQVRVAFVGYRDIGDKNQIFSIQDFTFDVDGVKNLISSTPAKGGQDIPEDLQGALWKGLNLSWRGVSVKIAYICTDAPCHGKTYHSLRDHYPMGNPAGLNLEDLTQDYSNRDIDLTVYELTAPTKVMYDIMEQAYNQGSNSGRLKRIKLEKEIEKVEKVQKASLTAEGGHMEQVYKTNMNEDLASRAEFQYAKHGWNEMEKTSKNFVVRAKRSKVKTDKKEAFKRK